MPLFPIVLTPRVLAGAEVRASAAVVRASYAQVQGVESLVCANSERVSRAADMPAAVMFCYMYIPHITCVQLGATRDDVQHAVVH